VQFLERRAEIKEVKGGGSTDMGREAFLGEAEDM
jgi:hypothetical protein